MPGLRLFLIAGAIAMSASQLVADTTVAQPDSAQQPDLSSPPVLVFVPPPDGAPSSRIGAGTRGGSRMGDLITLLVPDGGGLTTLSQPPLVWHLQSAFDGGMVVELEQLSPNGRRVMRSSEGRFRRGFHALDLARSDMALEPGQIYRWTVTAVDHASGRVMAASESFVERRVSETSPSGNIEQSAGQGLWFDALAPLFSLSLSGMAHLEHPDAFAQLAASAGLPAALLSSVEAEGTD